MTAIKAFFTAKKYVGDKLRAGLVAVHVRERRIFFGVTDKTTVQLPTLTGYTYRRLAMFDENGNMADAHSPIATGTIVVGDGVRYASVRTRPYSDDSSAPVGWLNAAGELRSSISYRAASNATRLAIWTSAGAWVGYAWSADHTTGAVSFSAACPSTPHDAAGDSDMLRRGYADGRYYVQLSGGTWDDPLVLNGGGYLWYDGTNIRGKTGAAPTSETDGAIII